jgi:hypothetical protein
MPVSNGDLLIVQGDDYAAQVTVSRDGVPPGSVLTGYTAQAQIRQGYADNFPGPPVIEMGTYISSPYINISIPKALTVGLFGNYLWDLQVIDPTGTVITILRGGVTVLQEVTRE